MEEKNSPEQKITLFLSETKEALSLAPEAFASGGEGSLFRILSPEKYSDRVAKIYHPHKRTAEKLAKLELLIKDPLGQGEEGFAPSFIWPQAILQNEKEEQIGVMMPLAQGKKLELLCLPKLPKKIDGAWKRLAFDQEGNQKLRLKIAFNLANAIRQLQAKKKYVLVDLKAENILVQPNGQIAIVDVDSLQISDGEQFFKAAVATPEYSAPEYYQSPKIKRFEASWDNFALAVILYKLFLGIHPFAASAKGEYAKRVSLHEKIEAKLYVHHPKAKEWLQFLPPPHKKYHELPQGLQNLFAKTFVAGLDQPEKRASPEDFCYQLLQAIGGWTLIISFEEQKILERSKALQLADKTQIFTAFQPQEVEIEEVLPNAARELMALKNNFLAEKQIEENQGCLAALGFFIYIAAYILLFVSAFFFFMSTDGWLSFFWYFPGALTLWMLGAHWKKSKQIAPPFNNFLQIAGRLGAIALLIWGGVKTLYIHSILYMYAPFYWSIWTLSTFGVAKLFSKQEEGHFFSLDSLAVFLKMITLTVWTINAFDMLDLSMANYIEGEYTIFWSIFKDYLPANALIAIFYFVGYLLELISRQKRSSHSSTHVNSLIEDYNLQMSRLQQAYTGLEANLQQLLQNQKGKEERFFAHWKNKALESNEDLEKRYDALQEDAAQAQNRSSNHLLEQISADFPKLKQISSLSDLSKKITALEKNAMLSPTQRETLKTRLQELLQEKERSDLAYFHKMQEKYAQLLQDVANWKKEKQQQYQKDRAIYLRSAQKEIETQAKFKDLALNDFLEELDELQDQKKQILIQKQALEEK
ncbi:protein kinase domain-containing protein [Saprospira grandis]|uniref:protein kinase domain-containing protein n=1 Tax=Saprospira grandis TaxID=1008 RepID=UPI0022DD5A2A|nr:protein kinase [Saprospira grandis]WBM74819.1 protein kinase [Saprospira grandis]